MQNRIMSFLGEEEEEEEEEEDIVRNWIKYMNALNSIYIKYIQAFV
jgi:hypothetical protein